MLTKGIDLGFTGSEIKQGIVEGYFALFNNKDLDGDIIERGAFAKTLAERGPAGKQLIKYLLDHDTKKVVAKITELYEDEKGLKYVAKIGTHTAGKDFQEMIESDLINQHSFGYKTIKQQYDSLAKANRLKELMMSEGSALQFLGANPETTIISLKNFEDAIETFNKLDSCIRSSKATDETLLQLDIKLNSLSQFIKAGQTTFDTKAENTKIILDLINKRQNGI
jgi:HK97 family phage prohead protease